MSLEETEMEVKNAPAAPEMVGEVIEVTTKVIKKEESVGETVVTTVTSTAVDSFEEKTNTEEKEPEDTHKILEEQDEEELEKERMEMEGGEEEKERRAKKLTGPWELEVRTLYV